MDFSSSKNPKKKRRVDEQSDPQPGPSSQVLPLVAPHLVQRSSKDPNRGLYPSARGLFNHHRCSSSPQFVKASELRRRPLQPQTNPEHPIQKTPTSSENTKPVLSVHKEIIGEFKNPKKLHYSYAVKGKRRSKLTHVGATGKITRYLKSSIPCKSQTDTEGASTAKSESEPSTSLLTWASGWTNREETLVNAITQHNNEEFFRQYKDCYGLVDNSTPEHTGENYFNILPTPIIENILCQIPILEFLDCRLVCTRWCEIIDRSKYMEWKKFYYKLKHNHDETYSRLSLSDVCQLDLDYKTIQDGMQVIMKYMELGFSRIPSPDMFNLLMQNPKGELADQVLSERFPELHGKEKRVWCQFAIAILISETVWDILDLYKSLFTSKAACSRVDVTDAMFCIASFLLYFRFHDGINLGLHYRLYYALYLIENHVPKFQREKLKIVNGLPGQQSMLNYSKIDCSYLTYEQIRILNHQFDMNQKIRIVALAGTGKTTTLLYLSKLYPQIKFLNLVFNRSVNEEAKRKFPKNVTCKTAHSLAYSAVGKPLRHKLATTLRPYDLINHLSHNDEQIQIYAYANLVLATINNFTLSSSDHMGNIHVPNYDFNHKTISVTQQSNILSDAFKIWKLMIATDDPFRITHDVYLKLYHLTNPKLNEYQCIMVDEAQDCNPVILDIVLNQTIPVIFVGDPNQQIYGFRGAQNALENLSPTHTYQLTKSFRFGPEISYIANCVLDCMLHKTRTTIVGCTKDSYLDGSVSGQCAIIARTNITLFNEALRVVVFKRMKAHEPSVVKPAFAGGIHSYGFDQISDIYKLKNAAKDKPINDKFIARFRNYSDLVNYAKYSDDADLLSKIEIVNQHGHDITKFISILKEKCFYSANNANIIFSTAHKSKGLEFDTVYLTDDYPISTMPGYLDGMLYLHLTSRHAESSRDEAHILYVAITRAKKHLLLPEKFNKVFHLAYEKFEYPVSSKRVLEHKAALTCVHCETEFIPHTTLMYMRRKVMMASGRVIKPGPVCIKCGSDPEMRPDVHVNGLIMYLDPVDDCAHQFMSNIVGPLPNDEPFVYDRFAEFEHADRVFVINLNLE